MDCEGEKRGTAGTRVGAMNAAKQFRTAMDRKEIAWQTWSLDDWLVGYAKFTMSPSSLSADDEVQDQVMATRKELCGDDLTVRSWSAASLRTYVNALASVYKEARMGKSFVPSSSGQFPRFARLMQQSGALEAHKRACEVAERGEKPPLSVDEMHLITTIMPFVLPHLPPLLRTRGWQSKLPSSPLPSNRRNMPRKRA